jgi:hypothetical protein
MRIDRKIVPTDGAKLLMHSFRLVTWHADLTLGLTTLSVDAA